MTEAYRRVTPYLALVGLAAAVTLRVQVAGQAGVRSETAAIWFAVALAAVALVTQQQDVPTGRTPRAVGLGVVGAAVLCLPALARHAVIGGGVVPPTDGYARWAVFVVAVAVAEEALLRGSLYRAIEQQAGDTLAIAVTSIAFGLLHAPVYGWGVVPLDIAVGVWFGTLRALAGSVTAPAVAHAVADLAGWWLR
ncbi:MAG TPA: CPBP family intramembrane glutamic endopeptidase [Gaiellales bacterium]|nr:CPBP family intramembrane glutamic endopeptidase [Gaiellales bacterium]